MLSARKKRNSRIDFVLVDLFGGPANRMSEDHTRVRRNVKKTDAVCAGCGVRELTVGRS